MANLSPLTNKCILAETKQKADPNEIKSFPNFATKTCWYSEKYFIAD